MAASTEELITKLQDIVECAVCLEQFEDPRLLACQHSFCTKCLDAVLGVERTIRCPCCNKETPIPNGVRQLPVDFRANTQLEIMSGYQQAKVARVAEVVVTEAAEAAQNALQYGYQPCPVCEQIPAVSKNLICGHRLCENCVQFLLPVGGDTLHCLTCSSQTVIIPTLNTYPSPPSRWNQPDNSDENELLFPFSFGLPTSTSQNINAPSAAWQGSMLDGNETPGQYQGGGGGTQQVQQKIKGNVTELNMVQQKILGVNRRLHPETAQGQTEDSNSSDGARTTIEQQPPLTTGVKRVRKATEEGKYALCRFCGQLSSDYEICEGCCKLLPGEPFYYDHVKIEQLDMRNAEAVQNPLLHHMPYHQLPTAAGKKPRQTAKGVSTRKAARGVATGRRRGWGRISLPEPETVIILSSDDEGEAMSSRGIAPDGREMRAATPDTPVSSPATVSPVPSPTATANTTAHATAISRRQKMEDASGQVVVPTTVQLKSRSIRIGSLKGTPYEKVIMSPLGIDIKMEYEEEMLELRIGYDEMMKVIAHFGHMPVLFVYTNPQCAARIRNLCKMTTPTGPYFDPTSKDEPHQHITIIINTITQQQIHQVREVCRLMQDMMQERPGIAAHQLLQEVESDQANIMIDRSTPHFGDRLSFMQLCLANDDESDETSTERLVTEILTAINR